MVGAPLLTSSSLRPSLCDGAALSTSDATTASHSLPSTSPVLPRNGPTSLATGAAWGRVRGKRLRSRRVHGGSQLLLFTSMTRAWQDARSSARVLRDIVNYCCHTQNDHHSPLVVDEFGGQYDDNFVDVDKHLLDYFTYKAVKTVLAQLHEMNPTQYSWFNNFVVDNKPQDSKYFLRGLVKESQELGERVMVTRLHLFNKWVKKYNHANLHTAISDQNLELLREHLLQTVKWPSDADDNKEL